jgi:LDH2 family malate/lactate/ureidoglycolate dehydrogenase
MVELLSSGLAGGQLAVDARASDNGDGGPTNHAELVIAMDPVLMGPAPPCPWNDSGSSAAADAAEEADGITAEPAGALLGTFDAAEELFGRIAHGAARLPADKRYSARRKALEDGSVEVSLDAWAECEKLASQLVRPKL